MRLSPALETTTPRLRSYADKPAPSWPPPRPSSRGWRRGEALLREARIDTPLGDELDGKIDAFLAGKEALLGAKTEACA